MDGLKILDMPPISPYLLEQVEKALDIKLYDWQKAYILDKYYDKAAAAGRASGKTLAYIIKRLLTPIPFAISKRELEYYSDGTGKRYNVYFREWALEINDKLTATGIKTIIGD